MEGDWKKHLEQIDESLFRINRHGPMNTDAMLVADSNHLAANSDDRSPSQLVNTASLPGIVGEAWAMADWGTPKPRNAPEGGPLVNRALVFARMFGTK